MASQIVYCTQQIFLEIIKNRNIPPRKTDFAILDKLSDIYVVMTEDELQNLIKSNEVVKNLRKRSSKSLRRCDNIPLLSELKGQEIIITDSSNQKEARQERDTTGFLVVSSKENYLLNKIATEHFRPYSLFSKAQRESLKEDGIEFEEIHSWNDVFTKTNTTPINAAIITDNYLFKESINQRKEKSLYDIISCLVPKDLKITFHLTIFYNVNDCDISENDIHDMIDEIHHLDLGSDIKVNFVSHNVKDTTHDRYILTNYHIIYSGRGFNVIDKDDVRESASGEISSVFHNIDFINGIETKKHQHNQILNFLKEIYFDKRKDRAHYSQKSRDTGVRQKYGDDFTNRLFL